MKNNIELITKNFEVYPQEKNTKRSFFVDSDSILLVFADDFTNKLSEFITKALGYEVQILILSPKPIQNKFNHDRVTCITINPKYYIHTFLLDPFVIKFVSGFGKVGEQLSKIFSQFNRGVEIDVIYEPNQLQQYHGKEKSILIKTLDGVGDLLMTLPTAKTYSENGYIIDYLVWEGREEVLKNVPYVRNIFNQNKKIYLSNYSKFFDISFKLSDTSKITNREHRVYATAFLCNLKNNDLVINKPEIFLDAEEIESIQKNFKFSSLLLGLDSNDYRRSIPLETRQDFISNIYKKTKLIPTVIGSKRQEYINCYNLTGKTSLRELFALTYLAKDIITTDSALLHIGSCWEDKNIILLPSTVPHQWRIYKNTKVVIPIIPCYPCGESNNCNHINCLRNINYNKIIELL